MAGVHAANQFTNPATSAQAGDVSPTDWGGGSDIEVDEGKTAINKQATTLGVEYLENFLLHLARLQIEIDFLIWGES